MKKWIHTKFFSMNPLLICHKSIKSKLITRDFQDLLVFQHSLLITLSFHHFHKPSIKFSCGLYGGKKTSRGRLL